VFPSLEAVKKTAQKIRVSKHALHALRLTAVASLLAAVSVSAQAPLDVRVALIIGNSAYAGNMALINPANDAKAMADVLKRLGFTVVELRDGNKAQMSAAIAQVSNSLKGKQGVGMLYYAGHGLQLDWRNYMVPVDANLKTAADVAGQTIDLSSVVDIFKAAGNRMNIVVLDACRDNPFGGNTSSAKGLAQLDAPPSTFLAYATAPGNVAEDGDVKSGNGLYTQFLLQELKRPTAKIEDVFKRVRLNVRKQSNGRQIPWESTSLEDDFFFNDGVKYTIKPEELERMAAEVRAIEQRRLAQEAEALERIQQAALAKERERQQAEARVLEQQRIAAEQRAKEAERLGAVAKAKEQEKLAAEAKVRDQQRLAQEAQAKERELLLAFELTKEKARLATEAQAREQQRLAELARAQQATQVAALTKPVDPKVARDLAYIEAKTAWDAIKTSKKADDFYNFLLRFPSSGEFAESAQYQLDQLATSNVVASLGKGQDASLGYRGPRFKVGDVFEFQVSDVLTKVPGEKYASRVTSIEGDIVKFNDGNSVLTVLGAVIKNRFGTFDPPFGGLPVELQIGKKWISRSNNTWTDGNVYPLQQEGKIIGRETVTVPAGTFQTFVVQTTTYTSNGSTSVFKWWVDPRYGSPVKYEVIGRSGSRITRSDRHEMIALKADRS
jgi:uncharacterized caspase-like protein